MAEAKPHHHGNLREALIDAGIEILDSEGLAGLSLRKAAARAGVSHAAPAHHFEGKDGLLAAIAARGFTVFSRLMAEERGRAEPEPRAQLEGLCRGYLRFVEEHEALFQLIFATEFRREKTPELGQAAGEASRLLVETCAPFVPSARGEAVNEVMVWSLVHGYASLKRFDRLKWPHRPDVVPFEDILAGLDLKV